MKPGSRDIHCRVQYGELSVTMVAEAVSWAPDAAADLMSRVVHGFAEALELVSEFEDADDE